VVGTNAQIRWDSHEEPAYGARSSLRRLFFAGLPVVRSHRCAGPEEAPPTGPRALMRPSFAGVPADGALVAIYPGASTPSLVFAFASQTRDAVTAATLPEFTV
jgi:hypothetical protein